MCAAPPPKLQEWKDFPKGLHVLVVISNQDDCNQIRKILESCSYNVTTCATGEDALAAVQSPDTTFHAAMVEATKDGFDLCAILEAGRNLPVIVISTTEDIGMMMQAISLGAADFLHKPFSEEKLRNIWQHVARKAMLGGEDANSIVPGPDQGPKTELFEESEELLECHMHFEDSIGTIGDTFELPFPDANVKQSDLDDVNNELAQGQQSVKLELDEPLDDINGIVLDADGGSEFDLDPSIFAGLPDSDSDSVLNFELLDAEETPDSEVDREDAMMLLQVLKSEHNEPATHNVSESSKSISATSCFTKDKGDEQNKPDRSSTPKAAKNAPGRKKLKVDWTPELHQKFVQAVEQLGVDKAIPSRILELMGEKGLTRHNVASHLQKYRSHRKHLLSREAEAAANWSHRRHSDSWGKNKTPIQPRQTPILPAPPCGVPMMVWGHPTIDHSATHMWKQTPLIPKAWQAPDGTLWQHPAACIPPPWSHRSAPGAAYPHMRMPIPPMVFVPQQQAMAENLESPASGHPPREVVDAVISEALTNPCTLPLGLKPPSMESVISELGKQGINIAPPTPS